MWKWSRGLLTGTTFSSIVHLRLSSTAVVIDFYLVCQLQVTQHRKKPAAKKRRMERTNVTILPTIFPQST